MLRNITYPPPLQRVALRRSGFRYLLLTCFILFFTTARAGYIPVLVTGYNVDAVCNGSGTAPATTSGLGSTAASPSGFDNGGYWLMDSTFNPGIGTPTGGAMPPSLNVNSAITPGLSWTLQSYSGNNALRIGNASTITTDSLIFPTGGSAVSAGELYFLYTNIQYTGGDSVYVTVNFNDGTVQAPVAKAIPNWFSTSGFTPAKAIGGRYNGNSNSWDNQGTASGPMLYQLQVAILPANYTKTIRSVSFTHKLTNNFFYIFGVTRNTVCSGSVTAGNTVSSSGTSVCPSINFNLSLPTATTGVGITYQWQSSATGGAPWTTIAAGTNATYTTNQTTATTYRAYIACSGGTADTSTPLTVTMKPFNQCYCIPVGTTTSYYISNFTTTGATTNISKTSTSGITSMGYSDYTGTDTVTAMQTNTVNYSSTWVASGGAGLRIYVDWNQNGLFTDAGENMGGNGTYGNSYSSSFVVPITALPGNTRMRVIMDYNATVPAACTIASPGNGEAEDYTFKVVALPPCITPTVQPTALVLTAGTSFISGSFTAATPACDKYLVLRTPGTAVPTIAPVNTTVYTNGGALGNATVISSGTGAVTFNDATVTPLTQYTYTVYSYNDLCTGGPVYDITAPLTGSATTSGYQVYTWNGNAMGSKDWQVATNWTPNRTVKDPTDVLQFTNGLQDSVINISTQTIRRILVTNQTKVVATATAAATITIASDNVAATNELQVDSASSFLSNSSTAALTVKFSGTGGAVRIAGTLEASCGSASFLNQFDFTNTVDTITSSGVLAAGGIHAGNSFTGSTAAGMQMYGTYNHKYATISGGSLPLATWNPGSNFLMSGYTTATGGPTTNLGQSFYNVTYNCPGQTSTTNWGGTVFTTLNNLSIVSTGTGIWQWGTTTSTTMNLKNLIVSGGTFQGGATSTTPYVWNVDSIAVTGGTLLAATTGSYSWFAGAITQTGGTLDMGNSTAIGNQNIYLTRDLNQTGGTFTASAATGSTSFPTTINFNGTGTENVNFNNAAPVGGITYRVLTPNGINLTGTGTLTAGSNFNINAYGGVRIYSAAAAPINTALNLQYAATNTTLTYEMPTSATATAKVWPFTGAPYNVTINIGNSGNILTVPFNCTVAGTLKMSGGDMDFGNNTLSIGTSVAVPGTLSWTSGNVRFGSAGSMVRWYGTSGLPTAAGTAVGYYPIANSGGLNRNVALYFSAATITTGGSITINHNIVNGLQTGLSVADGAYTINTRTKSSWTPTVSGMVLGATTIGMNVTGTGLFTTTNPANLRLMQANAVAGTYAAGVVTTAKRTGLLLTDLGVPYYIGAAAAEMGGVFIAINTGNWSTGTTWDAGIAPAITNDAYINNGVTVTTDPNTDVAKSLTVLSGGTLQVSSNAVIIDSMLSNSGTVNVAGGTLNVSGNTGLTGVTNNIGGNFNVSSGTVNLGPAGGGNKPFVNNANLTVSGGSLKVNGSFTNNAVLTQSAGDIRVDGNALGVATNSVAGGTSIVTFAAATMNFTGGTFTIVDPHLSAAANSYAFNYTAGGFNDTITHTFVLGDGISTDSSANTAQGMYLKLSSGSKFGLGNVIVNGSPSGNNRFVTVQSTAPGMVVNGNVVVNNYGDLRVNPASGYQLYLNGNLTVNAGGKLTSDYINFSDYSAGVKPSKRSTIVTVNGNGIITNYAGTANFKNVLVNNPNNITFNMGNVVSFTGTFTFDATGVGTYGVTGPTRVYMANNGILSELAGAGAAGYSQAVGWVAGRYQKAAAAGSAVAHTYPVGDSLYYSPVALAGAATAVTTGGNIWVSAKTPDHPAINTSTINPTKSINRYYTINPNSGIVFASGALTATFNWAAQDVDAGTVIANNIVGSYDGTTWTYPAVSNPLATSIKATALAPAVSSDFIVGDGCVPVNITTPPAAQTICLGSTATFNVTLADTTAITYQWQKNGVNIAGATSRIFTIPATGFADSGNYTVVLASACPSITPVTSATAKLSFNIPPAISTHPAAQAICENSSATFTVAATGTGITYQWQKNGAAITGATSASYTIPVVATIDTGNYSVVVMGAAPCGNVTSNTAYLTVKPLPLAITASGPTTFCAGGSVTLNAATAPATLTYAWKNNGVAISGQTNAAYTTSVTGNYSVSIANTANGCSGTSNIISVVNGAPISTITPSGTQVFCQGDTVKLSGPSTNGLTYQWVLNGTAINGATDSVYRATQPGSYTLTVNTSPVCSGISLPTVLNMNTLPAVNVTAGSAVTFCQGGSVVLNASPTSGLTYVWKMNGTAITPAATNASYTANATGNYTVSVTSQSTGCKNTSAATNVTVNPLPTVTITSSGPVVFCQGGTDTLKANPATGLNYVWNLNGTAVTPAATNAVYTVTAGGSYTVAVTNPSTGCQNTSAATTITVNPLPSVTVTASNGLTLCQGSTTNLCVPAAANQTYLWKLNGTAITGATASCYSASAAGSYTAAVTNTVTGCSAVSAPSVVTVNALPVAAISLLSASATACAGDTVWLTANNDTGISYQWKRNGSIMPGATAAVLPATATGIYTLVTTRITTGCTSTSAAFTVTVNPRPNSTIAYTTPITFCEGGAVVLNAVSATGVTYQWQNNGTPLPGATLNYYIAAQNGSYAVKVTNSFGCSDISTPPVLVAVNPLPVPQISRVNNTLSTGSFSTYQWYLNSAPISGATNQSFTVNQNGVYEVRVTDVSNCTNYSGGYFFDNLGVGTVAQGAVKIYPNPAHDHLSVDAPVDVDIILYDLTGKIVASERHTKQINIGDIADGIYFVIVKNNLGEILLKEKIRKQ